MNGLNIDQDPVARATGWAFQVLAVPLDWGRHIPVRTSCENGKGIFLLSMSIGGESDQFLFAEICMPPIDAKSVLAELGQVSKDKWFWDSYRTTWMLPVMTSTGHSDKPSVFQMPSNRKEFLWTNYAPSSLVEYVEQFIFSWLEPKPRIMVLRTPKGARSREHIDCTPKEFGTRQHKFRMVLQGRSDTLYFLTAKGRVPALETNHPFLIDGSWPHGMENDSHSDKVTVCIGAPWTGAATYPNLGRVLSKSGLQLPLDYKKYFERPPEQAAP